MKEINWKKINEKIVYSGYRDIIKRTFKFPNNKTSDFDIVSSKNAVNMLALTPDNEVILIEQFRPGPEKKFIMLSGGLINDKETPLNAAKREMLEETGYSGDFEFISTFYQCAYMTEKVYCYIVRNCKKLKNVKHEDGEFLNLIKMPLNEFRVGLKTGKIGNINELLTAYICLDYLNLL